MTPASAGVSLAAVDLGASSGRVVLGHVSADALQLAEVHRFRNGPVALPDGLYWDVLGLYQDVLIGLRSAVRDCRRDGVPLAGLAIDSWAVDYGLLDPAGALVANPRHYRDDRTADGVQRVHAAVPPEKLYAANGLQFLPFNTLYQLATEPTLAQRRALLVPDLLGYWLTGVQVSEETNASTTGLLGATTGRWDTALMSALAVPPTLFPEVVAAGSPVGALRPALRDDLGADAGTLVTTVGSHDTASAVAGVPAQGPNFAYISCGTWGLVGVELAAPVLSDESRAANFTNERGVDGTIRYLRNVMGLWLLSESLRTWNAHGRDVELQALLGRAAALPDGGPIVDPDDPVFMPPGDMPARIAERLGATLTPEQTVRCILDSLAAAFAATVADAERLSGQRVDVVHLVGGGAANALLCRLTANAAGRRVVAGPIEATAIGNLLVQARTHGALSGDLWSLRRVLRSAVRLRTYEPGSPG